MLAAQCVSYLRDTLKEGIGVSSPPEGRGLRAASLMNQMLDQGSLGDDRALEIVLAAYDGLG